MKPFRKALTNERLQGALCWLAAQLLRLSYVTGRWTLIGVETPQRYWDSGEPVIGCFWHGRMLMMPYAWRSKKPFWMMISRHRDGRLIADAIAHLNLRTIAGSSSRGAASALREMVEVIKGGGSVGITPDGPRGPRMRAQMGVVKLAQLSGAPIIPVSFGARRRRVLRSWDRFVLIWPFNHGVLLYGEEIFVPADADDAVLEVARREVEDSLNRLTREADRLTGHQPIEPADERR